MFVRVSVHVLFFLGFALPPRRSRARSVCQRVHRDEPHRIDAHATVSPSGASSPAAQEAAPFLPPGEQNIFGEEDAISKEQWYTHVGVRMYIPRNALNSSVLHNDATLACFTGSCARSCTSQVLH